MTSTSSMVRHRIEIRGVVQGVGFRPHVARLAHQHGLTGWVRNDDDGVQVEIQGSPAAVLQFTQSVVELAPPLARIDSTEWRCVGVLEPAEANPEFHILTSESAPTGVRLGALPPDTATCDLCVREMNDPADRRHRHAFITCTECGPRWTIATGLPYDRAQTTMAHFVMCGACQSEFDDPLDRRYHAQPIGCHDCGPTLRRFAGTVNTASTPTCDGVIEATQVDIASGMIVAVKGLGGYHLVVDATNDQAVLRLRRRKQRPDKPFAIMVANLQAARDFAEISAREAQLLASPARPIVLLRSHLSELSDFVAPASSTIGVMLPYTPLHHLLFAPVPGRRSPVPTALVMTSANRAGEPIVSRDDKFDVLRDLADTICSHDRPIASPCDDSVTRIINEQESPIRRSRGYAPLPISLPFAVPPLWALGGDMKNTCCVAAGHRAVLSQHIGDMETAATQKASREVATALASLHRITPRFLVTDRHPNYQTTRLAQQEAAPGKTPLKTVQVAHHHAHLAALMAEHSLDADQQVIGFVFDGTGWGADDTLWGGEVLVGGYEQVDRRAHLAPIRLPGGEAAVRNPWRTALSYLAACGLDSAGLASERQCDEIELGIVRHQISTGLNSPATTSMGRLFDAVASLLDVRHCISYEAQAALELETIADLAAQAVPIEGFCVSETGVIDTAPVVRSLVAEMKRGSDRGGLALGFHLAVAELIARLACQIRERDPGLTTVGVTGGVFQNDVLTRAVSNRLTGQGFDVLTHRRVPANDGGLSLGQAVVAGYRLHQAECEMTGDC